MDWAGELHAFFAAEGYQFVTALYGRHFNGYMGVGLAWPISECARRSPALPASLPSLLQLCPHSLAVCYAR